MQLFTEQGRKDQESLEVRTLGNLSWTQGRKGRKKKEREGGTDLLQHRKGRQRKKGQENASVLDGDLAASEYKSELG